MEKLFVKTPAGFQLAAAVHSLVHETRGLVVLCPGYLDTKDYDHLIMLANDLAAAGYTAVRFDPLGTWGSDGPIERYSMTQYLEDIRSVIDSLCAKREFNNVAVAGHSIGGLLSILYAAKDDRIKKVAGIMPPYSYVQPNLAAEHDENSSWAKTGYRVSKRNLPGRKEIKEIKVPYSFVLDSRQYNALNKVARLKIPSLLIAGERDNVIPADYVRMIFDKANDPKRLIVMQGAEHSYRHDSGHIKAINKEVVSFLNS